MTPTPDRDDVRRQGRREGERRNRRTLTALEARREVFVLRARRVLLLKLLEAGSATADDVRDAVTLPVDIDPKLFGSVPSQLAFAGIIKADGFVKTSRPKAHARPIQRWTLVDRGKAEQWLTDHPDRPDASPSGDTATTSPAPNIDTAGGATTQRTLFERTC